MTIQKAIAVLDAARSEYEAYRLQCSEDGIQPDCFNDWARDLRQEADERYERLYAEDTIDLY